MDEGLAGSRFKGMTIAEYPAPGEPIPLQPPTSVAFLGRTRRGPVNRPRRVASFGEFRRLFGDHCDFSHVSHAVMHFFANGGESAVIVRLANGATCARLQLPSSDGSLDLRARYPGRQEWVRASVDHDGCAGDALRFNLVVQRLRERNSARVEDQEIYRAASLDPGDDRFLPILLKSSQLVNLDGPLPSSRPHRTVSPSPGEPVVYVDPQTPGQDGDPLSDYDIIGSVTEHTGLFSLEPSEPLDLLCIPAPPGRDLGLASVLAAERYCRERGALFILDPSRDWMSVRDALRGAGSHGLRSDAIVSYFPRLLERSAGRQGRSLPACGAVAGIIARKDRSAGVWAPLEPGHATLRGDLAGRLELAPATVQALNRVGLNAFCRGANGLWALAGDVTFAASRAGSLVGRRLSSRRLAAFIVQSVARATRWAFFAGSDAVVQARVRHQVGSFLMGLYERGAFPGNAPEDAFYLRCDDRTSGGGSELQPATGILLGVATRRPRDYQLFFIRQGREGARISTLSQARASALTA